MAATKKSDEVFDGLTIVAEEKNAVPKEQTVSVFIPALEDSGSEGIKVDQYEHVTIANEVKENCYKVLRGEFVQVPVSVYIQLKNKYPKV